MLAAIVAVALAAPPLRLSDLLREAQEKNPDLSAASSRVRAAVSAVSPAGALDDPMLMVQVWNAPVDLSSVPVMLQITQPLPLGGKRAARTDSASADAEAAKAGVAAMAQDVRAAVAMAYFDLFLAQRTQEIDDEVEGILDLALKAAEARVSAGKAEQVDLLKAQAGLVQLLSERGIARDHEASAWARLAALLDRDPASPPQTTTRPAPLASLPGLTQLRDRALQERPELAGAHATIAGAEAQFRLARAAAVPDLALTAAAMHTFHAPPGPDNFFFAGVQVNLPIFSGAKNEPRASAAAQQIQAARDSERALRNKVASEVAEQYAHVQGEARQIALHDQLIPIATQAVESAEASYAAGRVDFLMVLDSVRELRVHHLDRAMHLAQYEQRLAELERAVGADLGLVAAAEAGHAHDH